MRASHKLTAITGGIGAGKSVVSRVLRTMGYEVYDCDMRARAIMDADRDMQRVIAERVCAEAIDADGIDRRRLAEAVFADAEALERLNNIVHEAVRDDLRSWASAQRGPVFVETAILYQSGLDRMVDAVWIVDAPRELRIERAMKRSGLTLEQASARVDAQDGYVAERSHNNVSVIVNDGTEPLIPQILALLGS